jgi:lipopolysaccharide/colanic/teichoic acid biosynthesis glycosyltransferase
VTTLPTIRNPGRRRRTFRAQRVLVISLDVAITVMVATVCTALVASSAGLSVTGFAGAVLIGAAVAGFSLAIFGAWGFQAHTGLARASTGRAAALTVALVIVVAEAQVGVDLGEIGFITAAGVCLWALWLGARASMSRLGSQPQGVLLIASAVDLAHARQVLEREGLRVMASTIVAADADLSGARASVKSSARAHPRALPVLVASATGALATCNAAALARGLPEAVLLPFGAKGVAATLATPTALGSLPAVHWARSPRSPVARIAKRTIDVLLAASLLMILTPVLIVTAVAIAVVDGRPIFFRRDRAGRAGRCFACVKFRTLPIGFQNGDDPPVGDASGSSEALTVAWKEAAAGAATPLGSFLRRCAIDELPQLFNVLVGHMSMVGPRPLALYEAALLTDEQKEREDVAPGLTGPWQVYGRSLIAWDERMDMDRAYAQHWTLLGDLKLLALTPAAVLRGRGAK